MLGYEDLHFSAEAEQTMGMPIATERYWTVEDVWALPVDPHHRYEAVDGELLVSPSPRFAPGAVANCVLTSLSPLARACRDGTE
jgi:hypothetical protein